MTDGYGVLWICGNLHEPVAVADPGGAPIWTMSTVAKKGSSAYTGSNPSLLDTAAHAVMDEASKAATQRFLDEMGW